MVLCTMIPEHLKSKMLNRVPCTFQHNHVSQMQAQVISELDPPIVDCGTVALPTTIPHLQLPTFLLWVDADIVFFLPQTSDSNVISWNILH